MTCNRAQPLCLCPPIKQSQGSGDGQQYVAAVSALARVHFGLHRAAVPDGTGRGAGDTARQYLFPVSNMNETLGGLGHFLGVGSK